ncbi:MAG: hypothetical protein SFW09_17310 [Hyphomicrobiaceae bacterium]|nr:hypothetical protein [Hyphomicrobiaceae bacterium]
MIAMAEAASRHMAWMLVLALVIALPETGIAQRATDSAWPRPPVGETASAPTRAAAARSSFAPGVRALRLDGYHQPGDHGAATYLRLPAPPKDIRRWHLRTADNAWWQLSMPEITIQMLGAVGDDRDESALVNLHAIRAAIELVAVERVPLVVGDGVFRVAGGIYTRSHLHMRFKDNGLLKPTVYSVFGPRPVGGGGFLGNVFASANRRDLVQTDILIENPRIDGSLLPPPVEGTTSSASPTSLTAAEALPSDVVGKQVSIVVGSGVGQTRSIRRLSTDRRTIDIEPAFAKGVGVGSTFLIGSNDNAIGFAQGARNVRIIGGHISNFRATWAGGGSGGKAVIFERGCYDCSVEGTVADNVSWGFFAQGVDRRFPAPPEGTGETHWVSNAVFRNVSVSNCEAAIGLYGVDHELDPSGDPRHMSVLVDGLKVHNCGHAFSRPLGVDWPKSGIVVIGEGQNVTIRNFEARNDPDYPGARYPPPGSRRAGSGHHGPIGAVVWGWGRNITISGRYFGNVDDVVVLQRARAMGDDASPRGEIRRATDIAVSMTVCGQAKGVVRTEIGQRHGTVREAVATTIQLLETEPPRHGLFNGRSIVVRHPGNRSETRIIVAYDGNTRTATVDRPWSQALTPGVRYTISGPATPDVGDLKARIEVRRPGSGTAVGSSGIYDRRLVDVREELAADACQK